MTYTLRQARSLLTSQELELFKASRRNVICHLSPAELRGYISRSRSLRDKFRDLYRRQTVATQAGRDAGGKTTRSHMGGENARTRTKAEMLADILQRFQDRLAKATGEAAEAEAHDEDQVMDIATLQQGVRDAVHAASNHTPERAPSDASDGYAGISASASAQARGAVPVDKLPAAQRQNVLKQEPVNMKIHASARGRGKAYQAEHDKRGEQHG